YIRDLEEAVIRALRPFGIEGGRIVQWPGVWVAHGAGDAPEKIAAVGVHISRWQTSHGFALNVNTDLSHFELIVPCGIQNAGVTSMQRELSVRVDEYAVQRELSRAFGEVFDGEVELRAPSVRTISTVVVRLEAGDPKVLLLHRTPERGGF